MNSRDNALASASAAFHANELDRAEALALDALAAAPRSADARHLLGVIAGKRGDFTTSLAHLDAAIATAPHNADLRINRARALYRLERFDETIAEYKALEALRPADSNWPLYRGRIHEHLWDTRAAIDAYKVAILRDPTRTVALLGLGRLYCMEGRWAEHLGLIHATAARATSAETFHPLIQTMVSNAAISITEEHQIIRQYAALQFADMATGPATAPIPGAGRLNLVYLCGFTALPHYLGTLNALVRHHDRNKFNVIVYADDGATGGQPGYVDTSSLSNDDLYARFQQDEAHIVIDLNGHGFPLDNRARHMVLARRPAPIIASTFNGATTLCNPGIGHLIADDTVIPPGEEDLFDEAVHRVAGSYAAYFPPDPMPDPAPPPRTRNGYVTFGCLGNWYKLNRPLMRTWADILRAVPNSRLLLRNILLGNDRFAAWCRAAFEEAGIASERIIMLPGAEHFTFASTYNEIDIALDTYPCGGGVTCAEALWMGVPYVTWAGPRWIGRVAASYLRIAGHPEWVGQSEEDYRAIAIRLAETPLDTLMEIRSTQRDRLAQTAFADPVDFTRRFETVLENILQGDTTPPAW